MKKIDILHFYAASSGSAGLYTNSIYEILKKDYNQELIVNHFYPFSEGKKIIYKYSDISKKKNVKYDVVRKAVKYFELFFVLNYLFFYVMLNKIKILNYNLTSDLLIEYYFLKMIKKLSCTKLIITCHDVIPFGISQVNKKTLHRKQIFFNLSDCLLVHNKESIDNLKTYFKLDKPIFKHEFPLMDLNKIYERRDKIAKSKTFNVSMIGHFRKEKGLDILLEAWSIFSIDKNDVSLKIKGNFPSGIRDKYNDVNNNKIKIEDTYLSDFEYCEQIVNSDIIVLPYTRSTNSGIPGSVFSLNTFVICSDIKTFKENKLIPNELLFANENALDLAKTLSYLYAANSKFKNDLLNQIKSNIEQHKNLTKYSILKSYKEIMKLNF